MKNSLILAIVCIGLGFAAGWILKPNANQEPEVATNDKLDNKPTRRISKSPAENSPSGKESKTRMTSRVVVSGKNDSNLDPETKKMTDQWSDMLKKKQQAKSDARLAVLVDKLNLTPEQEAKLRAHFDKQVEDLGTIFGGDGITNPGEITKSLTGDGLEDLLAEVLTPEQAEAHTELKKRERENKIEASALKNLAKLSFLDMSQEQKDAAYDILYENAETSVDKKSPGSAMVTMMTSGMGIEIDTDDLGFSGLMDGQLNGAEGATEPGDIMAKMKEAQAQKIEEKVEALKPVLDDKQLEQYRKHLETKTSGLFGGIMESAFNGEVTKPE